MCNIVDVVNMVVFVVLLASTFGSWIFYGLITYLKPAIGPAEGPYRGAERFAKVLTAITVILYIYNFVL
ncbi:hypothetical protein D3C78_1458800 [compost metagenome]